MCKTTIIFGTLKDSSLKINSLPLINGFSYRSVFLNDATPCKNAFKNLGFFLSKISNLVHFGPHHLVQILPACGPSTYQIMDGETLDLQCQHLQW